MYWTKCYRALPRTPTTRQEVLGKLYLPWRIWTDYYQNKLFWRRIRSKKKREPHEERNRLGIIILIYYLRAKSVFLLTCQLWLWYYQGSLIWSHHWIFWVQSCFLGGFFSLTFSLQNVRLSKLNSSFYSFVCWNQIFLFIYTTLGCTIVKYLLFLSPSFHLVNRPLWFFKINKIRNYQTRCYK